MIPASVIAWALDDVTDSLVACLHEHDGLGVDDLLVELEPLLLRHALLETLWRIVATVEHEREYPSDDDDDAPSEDIDLDRVREILKRDRPRNRLNGGHDGEDRAI